MSPIGAGALPLIAVVGPTGVGKSQITLSLAKAFDGEIINSDSRQIYRHMNIGTAKPAASEMSSVPHHLFDIIDPDQDFSLANYQELALARISEVHGRKHIPFLVGGSGQYVWAVLEGWVIPKVPPDWDYRKKLENIAADGGAEKLYQMLQQADPAAALIIDGRNIRRVIRALEVCHQSNHTFSEQKQKNPPGFHSLVLGLTADRQSLYSRVDSRVDQMIRQGFVNEVQNLLSSKYNPELPSMSSIGYRQISQVIRAELPLADAVNRIKMDTHRFVRHQYAWFRLNDKRICWFDIKSDPIPEIINLVNEFLQGY